METINVRGNECNKQGFSSVGNATCRCWNCENSTNSTSTSLFPPLLPPLSLFKSRNVFNPNVSRGRWLTKTGLGIDPSRTRTNLPFVDESALVGFPRKRLNKGALLVGVTYASKKKYKFKDTVDDVMKMRELLMYKFGYPSHCIRVLTECEPKKEFHPTKKNIKSSLKWLVEGCEAGDSLVFYFSGHGSRVLDFESDEVEEVICPVDFTQEGLILGSYINATIVRPLKHGVKLHAIVDTGHETVLDLENIYDSERDLWKDNRPPSGVRRGTSGGLALVLSFCGAGKTADSNDFSTKALNGFMTNIFIEIIKKNPRITYRELLQNLSETIFRSTSCQEGCLTGRQ